jgi:hypothetical protein
MTWVPRGFQSRRLLAAEGRSQSRHGGGRREDGLAVPVLDHLDQIGIDPAAAVDEGGVGGGQA